MPTMASKATNPSSAAASTARRQPPRQARRPPVPKPPTHGLHPPDKFYPALAAFTDAVDALPSEIIRHFTLLREVDAKACIPEANLRTLIDAAERLPAPEDAYQFDEAMESLRTNRAAPDDGSDGLIGGAPETRRARCHQIRRQINELLVTQDEKIHVISTAVDTLNKCLARVEHAFAYVEVEIPEVYRLGNPEHWGYKEPGSERVSGRTDTGRGKGRGDNETLSSTKRIVEQQRGEVKKRKQPPAQHEKREGTPVAQKKAKTQTRAPRRPVPTPSNSAHPSPLLPPPALPQQIAASPITTVVPAPTKSHKKAAAVAPPPAPPVSPPPPPPAPSKSHKKKPRPATPPPPASTTDETKKPTKKSHHKSSGSGSGAGAGGGVVVGLGINVAAAAASADDDGEETYCYCNQISYGEMVACDGDECRREWFHLDCVGLQRAPSGKVKWFCRDCKDRLSRGVGRAGVDGGEPEGRRAR